MDWVQRECFICNGYGKLVIGRNEDNKREGEEKCPICMGRGWLKIYKQCWGKPHKRLLW